MRLPPTGYIAIGLLFAGLVIWMPDLDAALIEDAVLKFGPVAIVALVALGIVVSPIPSGVIAMVAGALYGTYAGGALTIAGAVLGAGCAFLLSRYLGRSRLLTSQSALAKGLTRERSQNALTAIVFVTRLIPFVSFDAVSYVAGLTPLRFWRFLVATTLGTAPVCIGFAAAGSTAAQGEMHLAVMAALAGVTLLLPAALLLVRKLRHRPMVAA